jgi:hypothetical protein
MTDELASKISYEDKELFHEIVQTLFIFEYFLQPKEKLIVEKFVSLVHRYFNISAEC